MKLIEDRYEKSHTVILEKFRPGASDTEMLSTFVSDAMSVPEVIGGVYFFDLNHHQHYIEFKNQGLYTLLSVVNSLAYGLPIHIRYDDEIAPAEIISDVLHMPVWLIKLLRVSMTFAECFKYAIQCKRISETVPKQP